MKTIEIINARARKPEWSMAEPVNFTLEEGEHIAIIGRNGSGKSMFVDILTGRHPAFPDMVKYGFNEPYNNLKHITFRDTYGGDNDKTNWLARTLQSVALYNSISMNCSIWSPYLISISSSCRVVS